MVLVESLIAGTPAVSLNCTIGPREVLSHGLTKYGGKAEQEIRGGLLEKVNLALTSTEVSSIIQQSLDPFDLSHIAMQWESLAFIGRPK